MEILITTIYIGGTLYREVSESDSREKFLQEVRYLEKTINVDPYSEKSYLLIVLCFKSCGLHENVWIF